MKNTAECLFNSIGEFDWHLLVIYAINVTVDQCDSLLLQKWSYGFINFVVEGDQSVSFIY